MNDIGKNDNQSNGRVLIVDDDPIVAGMLGVLLKKSGFEVTQLESGESCLERINDIKPDVLFLDIEMPGMDGYETCYQLRARADTHGLMIIFLSAKDDLDSRLASFDVGADDFVAKPFIPEEVLRKVSVAVRLRAERKKYLLENVQAKSNISMVLSSLEETNIVLRFTRSSLGCRSLQSLASMVVNSLNEYGLTSHVQIRSHFGPFTMTPEGPASPLESSVIEMSKMQGRIFQFKRRMIVNYDSISILIIDMPIADVEETGRIRDYVAMICESAELAVDNIIMRLDANSRADELRELVEATRVALAKLQTVHQVLQSDTRIGLDRMVNTLEGMYISLGLLDRQEFTISEVVRSAVSGVMDLLDQGSTADEDFKVILKNLAKTSDYRASVENECYVSSKIELF